MSLMDVLKHTGNILSHHLNFKSGERQMKWVPINPQGCRDKRKEMKIQEAKASKQSTLLSNLPSSTLFSFLLFNVAMSDSKLDINFLGG